MQNWVQMNSRAVRGWQGVM